MRHLTSRIGANDEFARFRKSMDASKIEVRNNCLSAQLRLFYRVFFLGEYDGRGDGASPHPATGPSAVV